MSRSTRRSALAVGVIALVTVGLTACGGESQRAETSVAVTTPSTTTPQLAKRPAIATVNDPVRRAYIDRVDQVCKRLDSDRTAAGERAEGTEDAAEQSKAYDDSIALGERQLRQIKAIPSPADEGRLLRTNVFDVLERQLEIRREMSAALATSDVEELAALRTQLDSLTQSLLGFARGYGFRVCGED